MFRGGRGGSRCVSRGNSARRACVRRSGARVRAAEDAPPARVPARATRHARRLRARDDESTRPRGSPGGAKTATALAVSSFLNILASDGIVRRAWRAPWRARGALEGTRRELTRPPDVYNILCRPHSAPRAQDQRQAVAACWVPARPPRLALARRALAAPRPLLSSAPRARRVARSTRVGCSARAGGGTRCANSVRWASSRNR